jgi:Na+-transporting NADH:ubiquinone oxidoreductase subunit NqrB
MLKSMNASLAVVSITAGLIGTMALTISPAASAKTLVTCGSKGAAYIVDIVPAGCRVLSAASPPMQSGNAVEGSQLGFYFTASAPQRFDVKNLGMISSIPSALMR